MSSAKEAAVHSLRRTGTRLDDHSTLGTMADKNAHKSVRGQEDGHMCHGLAGIELTCDASIIGTDPIRI